MSQRKEKTVDAESTNGVANENARVAGRVASICKSDLDAMEKRVEGWRDDGLFIDPASDVGRRMIPRAREDADVFVAICLSRLLQVGMADSALVPLARLCCDIVAGRPADSSGDLWLVFSSGGMPTTLDSRNRLIDFVARAKGVAATVVDVGEILKISRG